LFLTDYVLELVVAGAVHVVVLEVVLEEYLGVQSQNHQIAQSLQAGYLRWDADCSLNRNRSVKVQKMLE
jgi:hypothetical protein